MKIHQQSHPVAARAQIGQNLSSVNWHPAFDRLDLDDKALTHEEVDPITAIETGTLVDNRDWYLPFICDIGLREFGAKAFLIPAAEGIDVRCPPSWPAIHDFACCRKESRGWPA